MNYGFAKYHTTEVYRTKPTNVSPYQTRPPNDPTSNPCRSESNHSHLLNSFGFSDSFNATEQTSRQRSLPRRRKFFPQNDRPTNRHCEHPLLPQKVQSIRKTWNSFFNTDTQSIFPWRKILKRQDINQVEEILSSGHEETWNQWNEVGKQFSRFHDLDEKQQKILMQGGTISNPLILKDHLMWGSVFSFVPNMDAKCLAAIFANFDGQKRYVPGMPVTRTKFCTGKLCRVYHRINPVIFFAPKSQTRWPKRLFNFFCYSYHLDEEVFITKDPHPSYAIRWTIPLEKQVMGEKENGEIMMTPMNGGTLITYNNATKPFGSKTLQRILPKFLFNGIFKWMSPRAQQYYKRTVEGFIEVARTLDNNEVKENISSMMGLLQAHLKDTALGNQKKHEQTSLISKIAETETQHRNINAHQPDSSQKKINSPTQTCSLNTPPKHELRPPLEKKRTKEHSSKKQRKHSHPQSKKESLSMRELFIEQQLSQRMTQSFYLSRHS